MIKEWLLARLLKDMIMLFDNEKVIYEINDIYFYNGAIICKSDKRWEND